MNNILYFSRLPDNPALRFGQLAEKPLPEGVQQSIGKYIVCRMPDGVSADDLPIPYGSKVFLKIEQLQTRYADGVRVVTDEDGNEIEVPEYGYYSPHGHSSKRGEVITLDDVLWIDPEGVTHGK